MKTLTMILLTFFFISCNGQDTLHYYPKDWGDSMKVVNTEQRQIIDSMTDIMQNPQLFGDTQIIIEDSLGVITTLRKEGSDLWYQIIDGSNRYSFWIINDELEIWLGDSLKARLFLQYELK